MDLAFFMKFFFQRENLNESCVSFLYFPFKELFGLFERQNFRANIMA